MPTQISVSVLFLTTRRTDEHEGKIREPKCLIFRNAAASELDDIVNSPKYEALL